MERDDDVERLFSWIKTPDLHYREFADREVADTAATWPAPRDAVPEPGFSDRNQPAAPSDASLLPPERARYVDRPAAIYGHHEPPPIYHPAETPAPRDEETAVEVPRAEQASHEVPWDAEPPRPSPVFTYHEATRPPPVITPYEPTPQPARPADQQYSGFEEHQDTPPAAEPAQSDKTRSLDAILSRVAHSAQTPRDEPQPPAGRPGVRSIFRRLR